MAFPGDTLGMLVEPGVLLPTFTAAEMAEGSTRSSVDELATLAVAAEKMIAF
jgi:hypothetical protein